MQIELESKLVRRGKMQLLLTSLFFLRVIFYQTSSFAMTPKQEKQELAPICLRVLLAQIPYRLEAGNHPINFLSPLERTLLLANTKAEFISADRQRDLRIRRQPGLIVVTPEMRLPDVRWITDSERTDLEDFRRMGGTLFIDTSPKGREGGHFSITSGGTPIIIATPEMSHAILAHELVHFRHWAELKRISEESGTPPEASSIEAFAMLKSVDGIRNTESRATVREWELLSANVRTRNWDNINIGEIDPVTIVSQTVYPELSQLVSILWTRDNVRRFRMWFTTARRERQELLTRLAERESAVLRLLLARGEHVQTSLVAELNSAAGRLVTRTNQTNQAGRLSLFGGVVRALEKIPLVELIIGNPDDNAHEGFGWEIMGLLEQRQRLLPNEVL